MPLYEYQCVKCKHRFERIRKFSDPPLKKCPECGGKAEQLLSRSAAHFKGTGWYVTDYARKSGGGSGGDKTASSSDSGDSKSGEKSGSKPAEKSESKSADKPENKSGPEKKTSGKD